MIDSRKVLYSNDAGIIHLLVQATTYYITAIHGYVLESVKSNGIVSYVYTLCTAFNVVLLV